MDHVHNPDNAGFCVPGCLESGVLDVSSCKGAPIIVSQPHFYQGSPNYIHAIIGMEPDEQYSTLIDIEPVSMKKVEYKKKIELSRIYSFFFQSHTSVLLGRVPTAQGKQGKWTKNSMSGKTQGIWKFCQNAGNLVCSSCKFADSKGKGSFDIFFRLPSQVCVCNSHKSRKLAQGKFAVRQGKHREFANAI